MPKVVDLPLPVRPYVFHLGNNALTYRGDEGWCDCPWCGKEGKWSVNVNDGLSKCILCDNRVNPLTFLRKMWECGEEATSVQHYEMLATDRGVSVDTLIAWGVRLNHLTKEWFIPGYSFDGRMIQLYRYVQFGTGKRAVMATPNGGAGVGDVNGHGLFKAVADPLIEKGSGALSEKVQSVEIAEGCWDGMALWESLRGHRRDEDGDIISTGSIQSSLMTQRGALVIAVPGANVFPDEWARLCRSKRISLLYDSDHPREYPEGSGKMYAAGYDGMRRITSLLANCEETPSAIHYLHWGPNGYDARLPSGYDVRDYLNGISDTTMANASDVARQNVTSKGQRLLSLLGMLQPVPAEWIPGRNNIAVGKGEPRVDPLPCDNWRDLRMAWKAAFKWTDGLERTLAVMLAAVSSVTVVDDQLWIKVISPPSGGKSTLCEALSIARRFVYPADTLTDLTSGYQKIKDDTGARKNYSLATKIRNKALVIKDGDTLLKETNLEKILSRLRAMYDRALRTNYGNEMSHNHEDLNTVLILCGTGSLRVLDSSELGERFLTVRIMNEIDEQAESDINRRKSMRFREQMRNSPCVNGTGADSEELTKAKRLTGGYVEWLGTNIKRLITEVDASDEIFDWTDKLARFVAYMRCRSSKSQQEDIYRELSARLNTQFNKLVYGVAVVMNLKSVDDAKEYATHVALDTAQGRTMRYVSVMNRYSRDGLDRRMMDVLVNESEDEVRKNLQFLKKIGVCETYEASMEGWHKPLTKWRLTQVMENLYRQVMNTQED